MKYKIAIVDDHVLIAKALQSIISKFRSFEVIYICENGKVLQEKFKTDAIPELILLDISMPVMDGFETANWLKATHPNVHVMALSMQDDDQSLIKMVKNGAKGYMLKNTQPQDLERALETLMTKGYYFPEWASSKIFMSISDDSINSSLTSNLSDREQEFLKYVATEMTYREISEKMFCSPRTIENYRDSLFVKLDVKSRVGLAVYALKNGFAE